MSFKNSKDLEEREEDAWLADRMLNGELLDDVVTTSASVVAGAAAPTASPSISPTASGASDVFGSSARLLARAAEAATARGSGSGGGGAAVPLLSMILSLQKRLVQREEDFEERSRLTEYEVSKLMSRVADIQHALEAQRDSRTHVHAEVQKHGRATLDQLERLLVEASVPVQFKSSLTSNIDKLQQLLQFDPSLPAPCRTADFVEDTGSGSGGGGGPASGDGPTSAETLLRTAQIGPDANGETATVYYVDEKEAAAKERRQREREEEARAEREGGSASAEQAPTAAAAAAAASLRSVKRKVDRLRSVGTVSDLLDYDDDCDDAASASPPMSSRASFAVERHDSLRVFREAGQAVRSQGGVVGAILRTAHERADLEEGGDGWEEEEEEEEEESGDGGGRGLSLGARASSHRAQRAAAKKFSRGDLLKGKHGAGDRPRKLVRRQQRQARESERHEEQAAAGEYGEQVHSRHSSVRSARSGSRSPRRRSDRDSLLAAFDAKTGRQKMMKAVQKASTDKRSKPNRQRQALIDIAVAARDQKTAMGLDPTESATLTLSRNPEKPAASAEPVAASAAATGGGGGGGGTATAPASQAGTPTARGQSQMPGGGGDGPPMVDETSPLMTAFNAMRRKEERDEEEERIFREKEDQEREKAAQEDALREIEAETEELQRLLQEQGDELDGGPRVRGSVTVGSRGTGGVSVREKTPPRPPTVGTEMTGELPEAAGTARSSVCSLVSPTTAAYLRALNPAYDNETPRASVLLRADKAAVGVGGCHNCRVLERQLISMKKKNSFLNDRNKIILDRMREKERASKTGSVEDDLESDAAFKIKMLATQTVELQQLYEESQERVSALEQEAIEAERLLERATRRTAGWQARVELMNKAAMEHHDGVLQIKQTIRQRLMMKRSKWDIVRRKLRQICIQGRAGRIAMTVLHSVDCGRDMVSRAVHTLVESGGTTERLPEDIPDSDVLNDNTKAVFEYLLVSPPADRMQVQAEWQRLEGQMLASVEEHEELAAQRFKLLLQHAELDDEAEKELFNVRRSVTARQRILDGIIARLKKHLTRLLARGGGGGSGGGAAVGGEEDESELDEEETSNDDDDDDGLFRESGDEGDGEGDAAQESEDGGEEREDGEEGDSGGKGRRRRKRGSRQSESNAVARPPKKGRSKKAIAGLKRDLDDLRCELDERDRELQAMREEFGGTRHESPASPVDCFAGATLKVHTDAPHKGKKRHSRSASTSKHRRSSSMQPHSGDAAAQRKEMAALREAAAEAKEALQVSQRQLAELRHQLQKQHQKHQKQQKHQAAAAAAAAPPPVGQDVEPSVDDASVPERENTASPPTPVHAGPSETTRSFLNEAGGGVDEAVTPPPAVAPKPRKSVVPVPEARKPASPVPAAAAAAAAAPATGTVARPPPPRRVDFQFAPTLRLLSDVKAAHALVREEVRRLCAALSNPGLTDPYVKQMREKMKSKSSKLGTYMALTDRMAWYDTTEDKKDKDKEKDKDKGKGEAWMQPVVIQNYLDGGSLWRKRDLHIGVNGAPADMDDVGPDASPAACKTREEWYHANYFRASSYKTAYEKGWMPTKIVVTRDDYKAGYSLPGAASAAKEEEHAAFKFAPVEVFSIPPASFSKAEKPGSATTPSPQPPSRSPVPRPGAAAGASAAMPAAAADTAEPTQETTARQAEALAAATAAAAAAAARPPGHTPRPPGQGGEAFRAVARLVDRQRELAGRARELRETAAAKLATETEKNQAAEAQQILLDEQQEILRQLLSQWAFEADGLPRINALLGKQLLHRHIGVLSGDEQPRSRDATPARCASPAGFSIAPLSPTETALEAKPPGRPPLRGKAWRQQGGTGVVGGSEGAALAGSGGGDGGDHFPAILPKKKTAFGAAGSVPHRRVVRGAHAALKRHGSTGSMGDGFMVALTQSAPVPERTLKGSL